LLNNLLGSRALPQYFFIISALASKRRKHVGGNDIRYTIVGSRATTSNVLPRLMILSFTASATPRSSMTM
jgi:hypothetical protein